MHHQPTVEIIHVGPAKAAEYLKHNTKNRPQRKLGITRYADIMRLGGWVLTPDAIAFDTNGVLINGQHRLEAIIQSGTTQPLIVANGLSSDAFLHADNGFKRGLSDHLSTIGYPNANLLASTARVLANIAHAGILSRHLVIASGSANRLTNQDYTEFVHEYNVELDEAIRFGKTVGMERPILMHPTVYALLYALYSREHDIGPFLRQVASGIGIESKRDPAALLRKRLQDEGRSPGQQLRRVNRSDQVAFSILTANLYVQGQKRTIVKWIPTKENPYPQPLVDIEFWRDRMPDWQDGEDED